MDLRAFTIIAAASGVAAFVFTAGTASAVIVPGGGSSTTDCVAVFDAPGANSPAPPKAAKVIDCVDGDATCDDDGLRNGTCAFDIQVCINSTVVAGCSPQSASGVEVDHSDDNGTDPKFDPDFLAVQQRVDLLGYPNTDNDSCTTTTAITVALRAPKNGNIYRKNRKKLSLVASGSASSNSGVNDRDKIKMTCRPEGDGVYLPTDLYTGTFDRIRQTIFAQSCALATCHDSQSHTGDLILYPNVAYSQIVDFDPDNDFARNDGLKRILPGDTAMSFLYRKITHDLLPDYGDPMPLGKPQLSSDLTELVRLWILGDMTLGPAPLNGWVEGTDQ
jgi:hypothetical protein